MANPSSTEQPTTAVATPVVPCCPPLETDNVCDILDFHYRLIRNITVALDTRQQNVQVEVLLHARLERCPGPLVLGDLVYSTTLFPGEKVRLFTTDRRTQFTFDSATSLSYRNVQTSEERAYMATWSDYHSDLTTRDSSRATNDARGSFEGHTEGSLGFLSASVDVSGSYDSQSISTFARELRQHAEASHHAAEVGTRSRSSVSIGQVQTRTHAQGQSEDHFESSSREFSNPNKCHAVTFFFYQINKTQTVKFTLESIERRVIDSAADTRVTNNPFVSSGGVSAIPNGVLATAKDRLEVEAIGRSSAAAEQAAASVGIAAQTATLALLATRAAPIPPEVRVEALRLVDEDLVAGKLLDPSTGKISSEAKKEFSFEIHSSLPTPGTLVKGCLDDCDVCEQTLLQEIDLDLARKNLENKLLERQIELLDKSQEYRCCPDDEDESKS
jgi:hypothetical protein